MCIKKKKEVIKSDEAKLEKEISLDEEDIEEVSGGIKWGDNRPSTDSVISKERPRRKK